MEKVPTWETELWDALSMGDGIHCPKYNDCHQGRMGAWCLYDIIEQSHRLEGKRFDINNLILSSMSPPATNVTCYPIVKNLEKLARSYLDEGGIEGPPVPTELVSQFDTRNPIKVNSLPLKICHGALWHTDNGWIIQLKEDDSPATKRFTVFHEAFHIITHSKTTPKYEKIKSNRGAFQELLADLFAIYILMPHEWIQECWMEVQDLVQMAKLFEVPKTAMYIRLKTRGLLD